MRTSFLSVHTTERQIAIKALDKIKILDIEMLKSERVVFSPQWERQGLFSLVFQLLEKVTRRKAKRYETVLKLRFHQVTSTLRIQLTWIRNESFNRTTSI